MKVRADEARPRLAKKSLLDSGDFLLESVECRCGTTGWSPPEAAVRYGIVFVRRGCFYRRLNGTECFVDPTVLYFERPGDEQQIAHPAGGDSCTVLYLSEAMLATIWGGEPGLPEEPLASEAATDLRQRLLLTAVVRGEAEDTTEVVVELASEVLERPAPKRVAAGRPATALARRRIVADAREALLDDPRTGVIELARRVAVSSHHLSRVFKAETGETIWTIRRNGRGLRRLLALGGSPAFSPDGRWVAFVWNRDGNQELYKVRADGTGMVQLTKTNGISEGAPSWQRAP